MKKRLIALLFVLALCALAVLPAFASDSGFVFDLEGVVGDPDALSDEARTIYDETGIALYFIYTEDVGGLSSEDYVTQFANAHGFYEDCIVLLEGPTSYYIMARGAAQDYVTEDALVTMRDAYVNDETYTGGIRAYYSLAQAAIGGTERPLTLITEASGVSGDTETSDHPPRLVDDGDLLTDEQEAAIVKRLDEVSEKHQMDLVIVTQATLNGKDDIAFSEDFYDYNGYGFGAEHDGLLLLYCPNENMRNIITTGEAKYLFYGDRFNELTDEIIPYFNREDFNGVCLSFADACDAIITSARAEYADSAEENYDYYGYYEYDDDYSSDRGSAFSWWLVVFGLAIGALLSFLIPMSVMKGALKSVRSQAAASDYVRPGSMTLTQNRDVFLFANITKTPIPRDTSSRSGGGGGGGFHTGSSGTSHGGGRF